jgi:aldehyde:ferredoxin oxidoreductase
MEYHGYAGQILYIDLTNRSIRKEPLNIDLVKNYIGGMGINSKLAFDLIKPGTDPLSPENVICYGAGPFVGTLIPGFSRSGIISKSPLTGLLGESQTGVSIGPTLKYAGYDHVVITGRAEKPVYIAIDDDNVTIKDATRIWGKEIGESTNEIRDELGDFWVSCIGPAGERLVRFANIIENKNGMIGRVGLGAVMGSKNLKAIAVRGTKGITVFQRGKFLKLVKELRSKVAASPLVDLWRNEGKIIEPYEGSYMKRGLYVTRNFSEGIPDGIDEYFTRKEYAERIWKTYFACVSCPAGDKGILSIRGGKYDGLTLKVSNPWGTPITFNQAGIRNWDDGVKCVNMTNRYGIDAFTTAIMIGFATEIYQKGLISKEDTGGLELDWSAEAAFKLIDKIVRREGIGNILAEGVKIACQTIDKGAEKYAVHVKGLEPTMDLRPEHFIENFGQLVDPRGAHHARGYSITYVPRKGKSARSYAPSIGVPKDRIEVIAPESEADTNNWSKARMLKWVNDYNSMSYSCGMCMRIQISPQYSLDIIRDLFYATTGIEMSSQELLKAGERIWNIQRLFNVREGASSQDDMPPQRMLNEPLVVGEKQYPPLKERDVRELLDEYYDESGWDKDTGKPTMKTLGNLNLEKEGELVLSR